MLLTIASLRRFKRAAMRLAPESNSGHLSEMIAAGFGFSCSRAMRLFLNDGRVLTHVPDNTAALRQAHKMGLKDCRPDIMTAAHYAAGLAVELPALLNDIQLPRSACLRADDRVDHPFPFALSREDLFACMRETWVEGNPYSTRERLFLVPVPPPRIFGLQNYAHYEAYFNWPLTMRGPIRDGAVGVLVKGEDQRVRGLLYWRWWGHATSGAEFQVSLPIGGCITLEIETRPTSNSPSIRALQADKGSFRRRLQGVREISPTEEVLGLSQAGWTYSVAELDDPVEEAWSPPPLYSGLALG